MASWRRGARLWAPAFNPAASDAPSSLLTERTGWVSAPHFPRIRRCLFFFFLATAAASSNSGSRVSRTSAPLANNLSPLLVAAMSNWQRASTTPAQLERLVTAGMLPARSEAAEWLLPGLEDFPRLPAGYVVSFVAFHERGFSVPAGRFIHAVLFQYGLQLQHLNPNGIQ